MHAKHSTTCRPTSTVQHRAAVERTQCAVFFYCGWLSPITEDCHEGGLTFNLPPIVHFCSSMSCRRVHWSRQSVIYITTVPLQPSQDGISPRWLQTRGMHAHARAARRPAAASLWHGTCTHEQALTCIIYLDHRPCIQASTFPCLLTTATHTCEMHMPHKVIHQLHVSTMNIACGGQFSPPAPDAHQPSVDTQKDQSDGRQPSVGIWNMLGTPTWPHNLDEHVLRKPGVPGWMRCQVMLHKPQTHTILGRSRRDFPQRLSHFSYFNLDHRLVCRVCRMPVQAQQVPVRCMHSSEQAAHVQPPSALPDDSPRVSISRSDKPPSAVGTLRISRLSRPAPKFLLRIPRRTCLWTCRSPLTNRAPLYYN